VVARALGELAAGPWPLHAIEIPSEPSGRPYARLAPQAGPLAGFGPGERLPVSVSISHFEGNALCAAALAWPGQRTLGIDLGPVEPRSEGFVRLFFTEDEQQFVKDAPAPERGLRANLVWCAKEAVLKALGLGLTVDTVELCCLPADGSADPAEWPVRPRGLWRPFLATCGATVVPGGGTVHGIWRSFSGHVGALASGLSETGGATRP